MQNSNSNPSHHLSSDPRASAIDYEARARAYERARARILAEERTAATDFFAAFTARADEHSDEKAGPRGQATPDPRDGGERCDGGARVTLDELLPMFRAPIEWALARAERHAQGEPVDLAALARVRTAYQSRLVWIGTGGASGGARPTFRPTDLLTVARLLVGSIDPSFAHRTSVGVRESLLDALAAAIPLSLAYPPGAMGASHPAATLWYVDQILGTPAPFGPPAPFGAPNVPRPAVPTCCCRHGHAL